MFDDYQEWTPESDREEAEQENEIPASFIDDTDHYDALMARVITDSMDTYCMLIENDQFDTEVEKRLNFMGYPFEFWKTNGEWCIFKLCVRNEDFKPVFKGEY